MAPLIAPVTLHARGILFDMDGILISSLGSVERCWHTWAIVRGVDPQLAIRTAHGCRAIETVRRLRPDLDADEELKIIEDMEVDDQEGVAVLPGVVALLASLPPHAWTVVTSATERLARVRLEAAGLTPPEIFISADSVSEGKPHPAPYLSGAALLGLKPSDCVVFEDSASGVRAGRAAGCTVVATTFSHALDELAPADHILTDLTQVSVVPTAQGLAIQLEPYEQASDHH